MLQFLILGANVHHVSWKQDGGSALHEAVRNQCSHEIVEMLLHRGANPLVKNSSGVTALDYAIQREELSLVRMFEDFADFRGNIRVKVSPPRTRTSFGNN